MPATTISQGLIARLGANLKGYEKGLKSAVRKARASGRDMKTAFAPATKAVRTLAKAGTVVVAILGTIGTAAIKMASDFQTSMAEVSTLLDDSVGQMDELSSAVKDLSVQFGVKLTDQARALYQTISAGATDAAEATRILEVANKAAVAGITDVAVSVEAIMRVINAYGLSADRAADVSDGLFTIVKKGVTTFGELAPQIGQVAGTAASAGVSMEELFAIIATATKALPLEQVITGVNALFLSFVNRTEDADKAAAALDVRFDATSLAAKGVAGVMGEVIEKLGVSTAELERMVGAGDGAADTLGEVARRAGLSTETIQALFPNVRALKVALALVKNEGQELTDQMGFQNAATGATQVAYEKMSATFGFLAKQVRQEVVVAFVSLGETLFPVARDIAGAIGTMARSTREWIDANQELIQQNVTQVFEGVVRGIGAVSEKIIDVVNFFRQNPLTGEFGLVGLVFLGPAGAAALGSIGFIIDAIINKLGGAQTVAAALNEKVALQIEQQSGLLNLAKQLESVGGGPDTDAARQAAAFRKEAELLGRSIAGIKGTIERLTAEDFVALGSEGSAAFGVVLESALSTARALQGFNIGDLLGGFEEGGEGPAEKAAAAFESMRFSFAPLPQITGEVAANLDIAAGAAARGASEFEDKWEPAAEDISNTISGGIGGGISDVLTGVKSVSQAFVQLGKTILRTVVSALTQAILQATILRGVMSVFGLPIPIPAFATGGIVPGPAGKAIRSVLHGGEVVLNRDAVASLGGMQSANRLNRGGFDSAAIREMAGSMVQPGPAPAGGPAAQPAPAGTGEISVRLEFPDPAAIPNPIDFGIVASQPAMMRFFSAMMEQARAVGTVG